MPFSDQVLQSMEEKTPSPKIQHEAEFIPLVFGGQNYPESNAFGSNDQNESQQPEYQSPTFKNSMSNTSDKFNLLFNSMKNS